MFNLINYVIGCSIGAGTLDSILVGCFLCLSFSLIAYYYKSYPLSFFLLYVFLTSMYFFIIVKTKVSPILMVYYYSISIFLMYHAYFTFSNRFYSRTIIIIKKYLKSSEYFKLIVWIVLVFITSLFGETFIFLTIFNPLFAFSIVTANSVLFFFLLLLWIWIFILIVCNKFKMFNHFLLKIQNYFSRQGCLHYLGNHPGRLLWQKVGPILLSAPIVVGIPSTGGYVLEKEWQTGNYAVNKLHDYQGKNPDSTHDQQYKVYQECYKSHANSTLVGRTLTRWGVLKPGAPELVIPEYQSELKKAIESLEKK